MEKIGFSQSNLIKSFFEEPKFHMADTFFDGMEGEGFVDNINNPKSAGVIAGKWLFLNG